ncbi:tetratricopeptide repeat protein [Ralstonia pseudosolanacearum]
MKRLRIFVASALMLTALCGWGQEANRSTEQDARTTQLLRDGAQLMASKRLGEAIDDFDKVIAAYEEVTRDEKAKLYSARWPTEGLMYLAEAANAHQSAKVVSGNWATAYFMKAYALVEQGHLAEAKLPLQRAIDLAPRNSHFLAELGDLYQRERDWPAAMKTFQAAEKQTEFSPPEVKNAELARAWRGQAYVYVEQNQLDEAEKLYRKCLVLNASDVQAVNELRFVQDLRAKQSTPAFAQQIVPSLTPADAGTYAWLDPAGKPTGTLYQLIQTTDGKWVSKGKLPNGGWNDISCGPGCEYRGSTSGEVQRYFSDPRILQNLSISCIQNTGMAFCSYLGKADPSKHGHLIVALTTGTPILVRVRRVDTEALPESGQR